MDTNEQTIRPNDPEIYNYAGVLADLAFHLEQEVLTNKDTRVAFKGKIEKQQTTDQSGSAIIYTYSDIEIPDVNKNGEFTIGHNVVYGKFTEQDSSSYMESISLLINGNEVANFMHASSPEVFEAVEANYELYQRIIKQAEQPQLASAFA